MAAVIFRANLTSLDLFVRQAHGEWRELTPLEAAILLDGIERTVDYIKEQWPVDTGTSKDSWTYDTSGANERASWVEFQNPMYYAEFVHYPGGNPENPIWRWLIPEAIGAVLAPTLDLVKQAILVTERRIAAVIAQKQITKEQATDVVYRSANA